MAAATVTPRYGLVTGSADARPMPTSASRRRIRRILLLAMASVMAASFSGCNKEICSAETLFGFLICTPDLVEQPTAPGRSIHITTGAGPSDQRQGDMFAGESFTAASRGEANPFLPADYIAREEWDIDGTQGYEQHFPFAPSTVTRRVDQPGLVTIRLRATDQEGNAGEHIRTLRVVARDPDHPRVGNPTAAIDVFANPNPVRVGSLVHFDASIADAQQETLAWDIDGEPGFEVPDEQGFGVHHTFWRRGQYTISARVRDAAGNEAVDSTVVTVEGAGGTIPPIATFSVRPNPAMTQEQVHFDGSGSHDPDGRPLLRWEWDLFAPPGIDYEQPGTRPFSTSYVDRPSSGFQPLFLRVTDDDGEIHTAERTLQLDPPGTYSPPDAELTITPNPPVAGQPATFDACASTDDDGSVARYEFDMDGSSTPTSSDYELDAGATCSVTTTYSTPTGPDQGIYVGVRITDDDGREDRVQQFIRVRPGGPFFAARTQVVVPAAGRTTSSQLFARFDRLRLIGTGKRARVRRGTLVRGVVLRGGIAGRLLKPNGEEATASPRVLGDLLRGRWTTRLDLTTRGSAHRASGYAIAQTPGRRPARACLRFSLKTGTPKDGRTPITGSFRVLGGDRAAARLRASGRFGVEIRPSGYAVAAGTVTSAAGSKRRLPVACRRLLLSRYS